MKSLFVLISIILNIISCTKKEVNTEAIQIAYQDERGRIITSNSLTYLDDKERYDFYPVTSNDVIIGGSFAGVPTSLEVLKLGIKGFIAHESGVGKNNKGIDGIFLAEKNDIPAATVETNSALVSNGKSVSEGIISFTNEPAETLGVSKGMNALEAAKLMLDAQEGKKVQIQHSLDTKLKLVDQKGTTKVFTIWSIGLVKNKYPNDIFCVASHSGLAMADYTLPVHPKAIFANDAGIAKDSSGVAGLRILDENGIAAIAVDALSAEIGNPTSTYEEGICSVLNETAQKYGVEAGMTVKEAINNIVNHNQ